MHNWRKGNPQPPNTKNRAQKNQTKPMVFPVYGISLEKAGICTLFHCDKKRQVLIEFLDLLG